MHLLTTEDLGPLEQLLLGGNATQRLRVRDPDRFPFLHELVTVIEERNLRNGYIYAYLDIRFRGHLNSAGWKASSLGPAGKEMRDLIDLIEIESTDLLWRERVDRSLPGPFPERERVILAWLKEELSVDLLDIPPPSAKKIFATYNRSFRRLFRGSKDR